MPRCDRLYTASGALFLLAFAFDLPDVALHGWLFLAVAVACLSLAARPAVKREA